MIKLNLNDLVRNFSEDKFEELSLWLRHYKNSGTMSVDVSSGTMIFENDADAAVFMLVWL